MKNILVIGAGRSSPSLITYLLDHAREEGWEVVVADQSEQLAREKVSRNSNGKAIRFDINTEETAVAAIAASDLVISLLPARFHPVVARHCLGMRKHFLSASYVSDAMKSLHDDARAAGLLFLNECGLDPGIDHMSAMQIIDKVHTMGAELDAFESFTGGLIAPETDPDNPWRYKFTWNPRNVVMAGQGTAKFLEEGEYKYVPYQRLFQRTTAVSVPGLGEFEGYANRDSLQYRDTYGLGNIRTMLRGTLRNQGFCNTWNILAQLGCCDDTFAMEGVESMTHRSFINAFLEHHPARSVEEKLCVSFGLAPDGPDMDRLRWSGFFSSERIGLQRGTPAEVLEHILAKRWSLAPEDKDMIVMWHRFVYVQEGKKHEIQSSLVARGEDSIRTAMARTVGLPLGIAARLLLQGRIQQRGVVIPVHREFYEPVLADLKLLGLEFEERQVV